MSAHDAQRTGDLLAYIKKFGPRNFADLSAAFLTLPATREQKEELRLRLKRMTETGAIVADGTGKGRLWAMTRQEFEARAPSFVPSLPTAVRPSSDQTQPRSAA